MIDAQRTTPRGAGLAFALALGLSPLATASADAPDPSVHLAIDDTDPERSVPTPEQALKNPLQMGYLLMELVARAEAATTRGDHQAAIRYYRATARAVPERAVAFSRLCREYEALGDLDEAAAACRQALGKSGVEVEDHVRFVRVLLRRGPLSPREQEDVNSVLAHLAEQRTDSAGKILVAKLRGELATRLDDLDALANVARTLEELAPTDPVTLTYRWTLAIRAQRLEDARAVLAEARAASLPPAALAEMEARGAELAQKQDESTRELRIAGWLTAFALLLLGGFRLLRRQRVSAQTA